MAYHQTKTLKRHSAVASAPYESEPRAMLALRDTYADVGRTFSSLMDNAAERSGLHKTLLPDVFVAVWQAARRFDMVYSDGEIAHPPCDATIGTHPVARAPANQNKNRFNRTAPSEPVTANAHHEDRYAVRDVERMLYEDHPIVQDLSKELAVTSTIAVALLSAALPALYASMCPGR